MADDVVGRLIFETDVDVKDAKKGLESFQDSMEDTQKVAQETEEQVGKAEHGISLKGAAIAAAVGAAVLKLGKEVAKATGEIQQGRATIVNATGATGEALQNLMDSAKAVYADSEQSFDEVSRAIGEVNTRLGYTDEALESTTKRFLDFADATGQDVQQSVIDVTQVMNRWNMEAEQLPSLLDKLTVAGQASGVSVAGLTASLTQNAGTLQALGYTMDESIALMMTLEKQGIDASSVLMGMKKSFEESARAGTDARADWEDLLDSIANATDQAEANSIAIDAFGNRIATDMVSALQSGSLNFDEFAQSIANAEGALEATDEASKTTADKIEVLKHSVTLMLAEVGEELAPIVEDLLPTVKTLLSALFDAIEPLIPVIGDLAKKLLPPVVDIVTKLVGVVVPIVENILPPLASALTLVGNILTALFTILTPILDVVTKIVGIGMNLVSSMLTPLLNLLTPIFNMIADAINAVLTPLVKVLDTIVGWIDKLIGSIKRLASWFGETLLSAFGITKGAVEDTTDAVAELTEQVDTATEKTERYSVEIKDFSEQIQGATSAIDAETEAQKKNNVEAQSGIELTSVGTNLKYKQADASKKTARQLAEEAEAQKELDRLEQERIKTTQTLTDRLEAQAQQIEENKATELEEAGEIEKAYQIREAIIQSALDKEIEVLNKRVSENKATEEDIFKAQKYYATLIEQNNEKKAKAIKKQEEKLAKEKKQANEEADRKIIESAEKAKQKIKDSIQATINLCMSMGKQLANIFSDITSNLQTELDLMQKARDKDIETQKEQADTELEIIREKNAKGMISDEEYEASKKEIEESLARYTKERTEKDRKAEEDLKKHINEVNRKAFIANKATAIAQAVIDGASAVMKAFAQLGPIGGAIYAGIQAGLTAAQVATIESQEYVPSYAIGTQNVPKDQYALLHQGELVLRRQDAERFRRYGGMYGLEQMASAPLSMDTQRLSPLNINNQLSAVIEVDGTQLGVAVLKNIDNASSFVLR